MGARNIYWREVVCMSEVIRDAVIAFLSAVGMFAVVWMLAGTVYRARHKKAVSKRITGGGTERGKM